LTLRDAELRLSFVAPLRSLLLDNARLVSQFASLERRSTPVGRDRVDHGPGGRDDLSNAAALALSDRRRDYFGTGDWVGDPKDLIVPYGQRPLAQHPFFGGMIPCAAEGYLNERGRPFAAKCVASMLMSRRMRATKMTHRSAACHRRRRMPVIPPHAGRVGH
jgi:hypothetical protein